MNLYNENLHEAGAAYYLQSQAEAIPIFIEVVGSPEVASQATALDTARND
jgi:hypothetical protein